MRKYFLIFSFLIFLISACSDGTIPTAVEPLIELQAKYITDRPVVDGVLDEEDWQETQSYLVHIGERDVKTGQTIGGFNLEMKALWWQDWGFNAVWTEQSYVAISLTWPDDDKNMEKTSWTYNPTDSSWTLQNIGSDWFLISWISSSSEGKTDLWYWDAAITNPIGYMEDQYIETFDVNDQEISRFNVDGLRFLNDVEYQNNCWDINYNDNNTPRDSTDDFPMKAWRFDPQQTNPTLPRIYTEESERNKLLLAQDSEFMVDPNTAPFSALTEPITIPGYILEDPNNSSADIMAAGKWKDGFWTVELVRACKVQSGSDDEYDITFNTDDRYGQYVMKLIVGDKSTPALTQQLSSDTQSDLMQWINTVYLTFEFIGEYKGD